MKVNIYTTYYQDCNPNRAIELKECLLKNLKLSYNTFNLFIQETELSNIDESIMDLFESNPNVKLIIRPSRPSFNDLFNLIVEHSQKATNEELFFLMNSDIFLFNLEQFFSYFSQQEENIVLALSRWDKIGESEILYDRPDSQDTWVLRGRLRVNLPIIINFGVPGCDNRLAWELSNSGYVVKNPSKSIKTIHYHQSNVRNYLNDKREIFHRLPRPYLLLPPTY